MSSIAKKNGMANSTLLFQPLTGNQEFSTTQNIRFRSKVLMVKKKTETQHGLDILSKTQRLIFMIVSSGTHLRSLNGLIRNQSRMNSRTRASESMKLMWAWLKSLRE
jgi:hypothetical protein